MPIYEYQCSKCGQFEVMQRITEKPLTRCPTCRSKVTKLISNTSFQLKGSGWYITDYARKGGKSGEAGKDAASEQTSSAESASKAEKSEKSGAKSETKAAKSKEAAAA